MSEGSYDATSFILSCIIFYLREDRTPPFIGNIGYCSQVNNFSVEFKCDSYFCYITS